MLISNRRTKLRFLCWLSGGLLSFGILSLVFRGFRTEREELSQENGDVESMNSILRQKASAVDDILLNSSPFKSALIKYPMDAALKDALKSKARLLDDALRSKHSIPLATAKSIIPVATRSNGIWIAQKVAPPGGTAVTSDSSEPHKDLIARAYLNYVGSAAIPKSGGPEPGHPTPVFSKISREAARLHVFLPPLPSNGYYGNDLLVSDVAGTVHSVTTGQPLQGAALILVSAPRYDVHSRVFVPGGKRRRNVAAILSEVAEGLAAVGGAREDGRHGRVALFSSISGVRGQFVLRAAPGVYQVVGDLDGYAQSTSEPLMTRAEAAAHVRMMLSPLVPFAALRFCLLWGARWWHPAAPAARMALTIRAPTGCIRARAGVVGDAAEPDQVGALAAAMCAAAHRGVRGTVDVAMNRGGPLTITLDRTAAEIYTVEVELREELAADVAAMAVRRCSEALNGMEAELRVYTYDGGERGFRVERDGEIRAGGRCVWIAARVDGAEAHLLPVNRVPRPETGPEPALGAEPAQATGAPDSDPDSSSGDGGGNDGGGRASDASGEDGRDGAAFGEIGIVALGGGGEAGESAAQTGGSSGPGLQADGRGGAALGVPARHVDGDGSSDGAGGQGGWMHRATKLAGGGDGAGVADDQDSGQSRAEAWRGRAEERLRRKWEEGQRAEGRGDGGIEGRERREDAGDGAGGDVAGRDVPETVTVTTTDLATGKVTTRTETLTGGGGVAAEQAAAKPGGDGWDGGHRWVGRRPGSRGGGDGGDEADADGDGGRESSEHVGAAETAGDADSEDAAGNAAAAAGRFAPRDWCEFRGGSGAVSATRLGRAGPRFSAGSESCNGGKAHAEWRGRIPYATKEAHEARDKIGTR